MKRMQVEGYREEDTGIVRDKGDKCRRMRRIHLEG